MARTDANPPMPDFAIDYQLQEVDPGYLTQAVKPKQFLHIDQAECILCEGCVDICPWKCIHMVSVGAIAEAVNTEQPGEDPRTTSPSSSTRTSVRAARSASTAARPASSSSASSRPPSPTVTRTSAPNVTGTHTGSASRPSGETSKPSDIRPQQTHPASNCSAPANEVTRRQVRGQRQWHQRERLRPA